MNYIYEAPGKKSRIRLTWKRILEQWMNILLIIWISILIAYAIYLAGRI